MDLKTKLTRSLRSSTSTQEGLNRKILKWSRSFRQVERLLNRGGRSKQAGE